MIEQSFCSEHYALATLIYRDGKYSGDVLVESVNFYHGTLMTAINCYFASVGN